MSTHLYLRCINHEPFIESGEVGNNLGYLDAIRHDVRNREMIVKRTTPDPDLYGGYSTPNAYTRAAFFRAHPKCELELWDEYGKQHSLDGELIHGIVDDNIGCGHSAFNNPVMVTHDNEKITCRACREVLAAKE